MNTSLKRILLATDGSENAALAGRAAADVSGKTGAELHVVHAWQNLRPGSVPPLAWAELSRAHERYKRKAAELLETEAQRVRESGGTVARAHLREGRPADEIAALAEELATDLVVVGSREAGWVKRLVTGSVSEGLVHGASCPVLIVRGGEGAWPPARFVVGEDGSAPAQRASELAAEIARLFGAEVVLVRAYENPPEPVGGWSAQDRRELDEDLHRRREDLVERAEPLAALTQRRAGTRLIEMKAAPAMSLVAGKRDEGRTLLAVGSRGLGALDRALSGSVSTNVLRAAHGPVLVVPSEKTSAR